MLYVFIVSSGVMLKFDMNLAIKKVQELKKEIAREISIPPEEQVLLCSGGEELQPENTVGYYHGAGTDTNPIFLFIKYPSEMLQPFSSNLTSSTDMSISHDVEDCAAMSPSSGSLTVKQSLAQRFAEYAEVRRRECEELVFCQHLQQQGWAAVIANLEDAKDSLIKRKIRFEELFCRYLKNRPSYIETIYMFPKSIELLSKIPLLPKLILEDDVASDDLNAKHTLLSWFISEPQDALETLVEKCRRLLEELDEHTIVALNDDFQKVIKNVDNNEMKQIKGIGDRLSGLNTKVEEGRRLEKEQSEMIRGFNSNRAVIDKDPQSIPSVCTTFQSWLQIMLQNHIRLRATLDICIKTKTELSHNINTRLNVYITKVESEMYQLHMRIVLLESHVQSVMSQVESYHQVQLAPERYLSLLTEVCRRKVFSTNYIKWARELSSHVSKMYDKELSIRRDFSSVDLKNMVDNLFPGMGDVPPPFAVDCPPPFDQHLPNIVKEDLESMKALFPELSNLCEVPPPDPMPYISQVESDSAFSSNVPSSRVASDSAITSEKVLEEEAPADKLAVPSIDYSSLPSEYASLPNEVFSLTSSPFEDPLLPSHMQERTKTLSGARADSDGEEFETLDHYRTSPVAVITQRSAQGARTRPTSSSDVIDVNTQRKHYSKVSKARSDGDAVSPMQERLKSPDSLAMSADFQAAEYYIDDSMPSSYTESNATSPLMRGSRMVKSHHVVISELQRQVEEKNGALSVTKNSLENTHSNILKLHAKISALQKYIQELQGSLRSDLSSFKTFVTEELSGRMTEVSHVVDYINTYVGQVAEQMALDKEIAVSQLREELTSAENEFLRKLELQNQKLSDAENQIAQFEDNLRAACLNYEETKSEKELLECELQDKKEMIKRMMLEHELEYDAYKNSIRDTLQGQESEINNLKESLSEALLLVQKLEKEKEYVEQESKSNLSRLAILQVEKDGIEMENFRLQKENQSMKASQESECKLTIALEENNKLLMELEKANEELNKYKEETEKQKSKELKELEDKLSNKHKSDMESLRSRFKLAVSMTSLEKSPVCSPEACDAESLNLLEEMKNVMLGHQQKWESDVLRNVEIGHQKELETLKQSAEEAFLKHKEEKAQIIESLRSKHRNALEELKSRITAENQVSFNEAINGLAKEKDSVIENLCSRISLLEARQFAVKNYLENYRIPSGFQSSLPTGDGVMSQSESVGITSARAVLPPSGEQASFLNFKADVEALLQLTDTTKSSYQLTRSTCDSYESLRKKLKTKEDEYNSLLHKFMSSSASTSGTSCCVNKLSIFTCEPGEFVIVNYEEKLGHYTIYHLGTYLHFLHSDSMAALDLKIPPVRSQSYIIGVVSHKEFCVTKKVNNRFKLILGSKFFRVKVERWGKKEEAAKISDSVLQQSIQPNAEPAFLTRSKCTQTIDIPSENLGEKRKRPRRRSRSVMSSASV